MKRRTTIIKKKPEKVFEEIKISKLCPISVCTTADEDDDYSHCNPTLRLQNRALVLSEIATIDEAYEIDDYNLYKIIGEYNINLLSEKFHKKCIDDADESFSSIFQQNEFDDIVANFSDFLQQRLGGSNAYTANRGGVPCCLNQIHNQIEVTNRTVTKWIENMTDTVDELITEKIISDKFRVPLMNYFRYTCYFLLASQEAQCLMVTMGTFDILKDNLTYDNETKL